MEQTFERVRDGDGKPIPWLYVRQFGNRRVKLFYAIFTDWQHIRRRIALGKNLTLQQAIKKLGDVEKKNTNEFDFDKAKARNVTLSKWAEECASAMKPRDVSLLAHLKAVFGSKLLTTITGKDLIDYRARRLDESVVKRGKATNKKTSPTTVNKELGLLRKLMRLAKGARVIRDVPTFVMDKELSRERTLTMDEYTALLENCPEWLRRVCIGANETCLSRSDLLTLTWKEVDRQNWIITVMGGRNKTKVKQQIPIRTPELKTLFAVLDGEFKKLPNTEGVVFTCNGHRIKPMQLRRALQRACTAAGISDFTLHDFRHCAITRWHKMKVPPATAMRMAGQSSIQSFKKYINMDANDHAEVFTNCLQEHSAPAKKSGNG